MNVKVEAAKPEHIDSEIVIIPFLEEQVKDIPVDSKIVSKDFRAELSQAFVVYDNSFKSKRVMLLGLGKKKEFDIEKVRRAFNTAVKKAASLKINRIATALPDYDIDMEDLAVAVTEGCILGNYSFDKYKKKKDDKVSELKIIVDDNYPELRKEVENASKVCNNSLLVRDLVNENSKDKNPLAMVDIVKAVAKKSKLKLKILDEKDMKKLGMNLILAVNQGASVPARMLILEYNGNKKSKDRHLVVGKGITFDTGGLNIKPSGPMGIDSMKLDMAGAATVLGVIKSVSDLKLKVNLIGVMTLTDNAIDSKSYKPGDVYISYSKKSVEIVNTDAEGRLILADTLSYTIEKYKPKYIINLATLTGSCLVALGTFTAGLMGNDKILINNIENASNKTSERVWQLPLFDDFREDLKSEIADIGNLNRNRWAGAIIAGTFLKDFVGNAKWAHLDIAGPAWGEKSFNYMPQGGTGFGVRLLTKLFENMES